MASGDAALDWNLTVVKIGSRVPWPAPPPEQLDRSLGAVPPALLDPGSSRLVADADR